MSFCRVCAPSIGPAWILAEILFFGLERVFKSGLFCFQSRLIRVCPMKAGGQVAGITIFEMERPAT